MAVASDNTSAHFLHEILSSLHKSTEMFLSSAWGHVLEASYGTPEFCRRHAEVVNLLKDTIDGIAALPERAKARHERYIDSWWNAVISPTGNWGNSGHKPSTIIDDVGLDQLGSAADLLSIHCAGSAIAPAASDLGKLRESCEEWLQVVSALNPGELPDGIKAQLLVQIKHLIWLVDISPLIGQSRVVQESGRLVGVLANATAAAPEGSSVGGQNWREKFVALFALVAVATTGTEVVTAAIDAGQGAAAQFAGLIAGASGE
ncbi:hypothetical protein OHT59_22005 [Streptomyces sp. NBC_00243]|uniref:hypothetical protein n=1 Tax=Streptomyces sp. NBC_00243 TaxID=2975688 RepID=UPI002DD80DA0|nr:hypothetical protein [Streptomyces sp. NBC_00243]WRZ20990.1 hypothetical protein OHT59_22005 [Streptomyces sp. NBC_00243]